MRLTMLLAMIATMMAVSPALAQSPYGGYTKVRPASMKTRKVATRTTAATHTEAAVVSHGYHHDAVGCDACNSGCDSCSSGCNSCCKPPLLPSLIDNLPDLFACLHPCPTPYKSCAAGPHCCPYPKRPVINNHCRPNLLDAIFGTRGCCKSSACTSCSTGCATSGCASCTAGAIEAQPELIVPPNPEAEMENPFRDDPVQMPMQRGAVRSKPATKTTSRQQQWYKTVRHAPVVVPEDVYEPSVLVVGGAQPLVVGD